MLLLPLKMTNLGGDMSCQWGSDLKFEFWQYGGEHFMQ
jgi:hypothetical protein